MIKIFKTGISILLKFLGIELKRLGSSRISKKKYRSYEAALKDCQTSNGYESTQVVDVVFEKTLKYATFLEASAVKDGFYETPVSFYQSILLNIIYFISQQKKSISVIDFGGACGAHYFFVRKFLNKETLLKWQVVETPSMVKRASQISNNELKFYTDVNDAVHGGGGGFSVNIRCSSVLPRSIC